MTPLITVRLATVIPAVEGLPLAVGKPLETRIDLFPVLAASGGDKWDFRGLSAGPGSDPIAADYSCRKATIGSIRAARLAGEHCRAE